MEDKGSVCISCRAAKTCFLRFFGACILPRVEDWDKGKVWGHSVPEKEDGRNEPELENRRYTFRDFIRKVKGTGQALSIILNDKGERPQPTQMVECARRGSLDWTQIQFDLNRAASRIQIPINFGVFYGQS